jgi:hypothetical protein
MAEHVLAEPRNAAAAPPQHRIGPRRPITANYLNWLLRAGFALHLPDKIDQMRIHARLFGAAPVAQEPVKLLQRGIVVTSVALVGDRDVFTGMQVMHRDGARVAFRDRVLQRL